MVYCFILNKDNFFCFYRNESRFKQTLCRQIHTSSRETRQTTKSDIRSVADLFFFYTNYIRTDNGTFDNKEMAFVERMRIQVMQNLVLKIHNLHISYEMKSPTKLGHPFSFGITFHYLELTV